MKQALITALLFLMGGTVMAQSDSPYVIKIKGSNHYLAHVQNGSSWEVTDATTFSPDCIWYSGIEQNATGTTHNYYFDDGTNLHFLSAPMTPNGSLGLSSTLPPTYLLSNTDTIYYFYDWDSDNNGDGGGVARGHQYYGYNQTQCVDCNASWSTDDNQCWRVYWVAYKDGTGWKLTSSHYSINDIPSTEGVGGRYRKVTANDVITPVSGGLTALTDFGLDFNGTRTLSAGMTTPYTYKTYTLYSFVENGSTSNHYYYNNADHTAAPTAANGTGASVSSYEWTISGPGADYLTFETGNATSASAMPTLSYSSENKTGDKAATLKLKVTYNDGSTQESTATVTVKTACQNPPQASAPVVSFNDVTVSWYDIAENYQVQWKTGSGDWSEPVEVNHGGLNTRSYTIHNLAFNTTYQYRVRAYCSGAWILDDPTAYSFTTQDEPELLIYGSVYGGGRVADVTGKTEVVVINCDSIGAIFGGNDIAGTVYGNSGADGSSITLGVNTGDTYASYGTTSATLKVGSVYGGGNGYYAYGSNVFHEATATNYNTVAVNAKVYALSQSNQWTDSVWTNNGTVAVPLPTISKTAITVANDYVKVDTVFGGAKNAFLTANSGNGSAITINGGTMASVFGGNNIGGSQETGKHYIKVDEAAKDASTNYLTRIHTLYGGGNKVTGSETDILVNGGQIDTLYAGGNSASVTAAKVEVNCELASGSGTLFGKTYSNAIESYDGSTITVKDDYAWNGTGVYNVHTLFGGNNQADMAVVPTITLTSGSVGTVYGGGNAGDMNAEMTTSGIATDFGALVIENVTYPIYHSTHVVMNSANMLVDYLYGGCQMSNVYRSTWVEIGNGHVGTVYGGCNISGDVGSRYLFSDAYNYRPRHERYQAVMGATYVKVSGGHIYKDLFAGSNGRYHCNNNKVYVAGIDFDNLDTEGRYLGMSVPSHNETHVYVSGTAEVGGSVYAGGNLACVGFINESVPDAFYTPVFVGMATVRMNGGHVHGNVFGGGNMASIWGSNSVKVEGGTIDGALYGGNDRIGLVAQITNRVLPSDYGIASDGLTSLADVRTYISVTGRPEIATVYGGGNGDYDYTTGEYCNPNDQPVQSNTFVDINIDGFADGSTPGGHIGTVYGGGNGVTVTGSTTVFLNVKGPDASTLPTAYDHVGTIFGGNNKGPLAILPDIYLIKGQVNTVYGGCNAGAMVGSFNVEGYSNVGSRVILRDTYTPVEGGSSYPLSGVVSHAVYGGCRMNDVNNNTLVLVQAGSHPNASLFGGCDISGDVNMSHVVVTGGQVGNVYGGGNGNYTYDSGNVYTIEDTPQLVATNVTDAPRSTTSVVDILGGQVGTDATHTADVFGGGYGHLTNTTGDVTVNIGVVNAGSSDPKPTIYGDVYGGSALGNVNTSASNTTTVNVLNGTLNGNVYGGGLGSATLDGNGYINTSEPLVEAIVNGTVHVNIGSSEETNHSNYLNITGSVFGGNNLAGTPKANVYVDVYRTAHTTDNTYPSSLTLPVANSYFENANRYALKEVYGGGNLAHYDPTATDASTYVRIHGCENTVQYVYGGGNAANVPAANVTIDGGLFQYVFGGGNGYGEGNPGANVLGDNTLNLDGGVTCFVFGGSNTKGAVSGETNLLFAETPNCSVRSINELYGGGNQAADLDGITLNIPCGTSGVNLIFGGARMADVGTAGSPQNVVLNVRGGELDQIYGGNNISGTIYGNVTLNLYGGTINKAFGGNNAGGDILGSIQVNVEDAENTTCPLNVNTVYGGGNMAAYTPTDATISSPEVNVIHGTINDAVYGGGMGSGATVNANPIVTIGDNEATHKAIVGAMLIDNSGQGSGNVYGGGDAAAVDGSTTVIYADNNANSQVNRLFGGGNQANAGGATVTMTSGKVLTGIYGGCNANGNVSGAIEVNINGGTLGVDGTPMASGIFGGGYGQNTTTTNDVTVNIGDGTNAPTIYADVYGGSALGKVHTVNTTTDKTTVNFAKGTLHGNLYGGGLGQDSPAISAEVNGNVEVNIGKDKNNATVTGGVIYGSVFGANNVKGSPKGNVTVNVYSATMDSIFGGGNRAAYVPAVDGINYPAVNISDGTVNHKVVGGGNAAGIGDATASITANPHITISGGTFGNATGAKWGVYGGCNASGTVNGDVVLDITGGTFGDQTNINNNIPYNIHGGGYGQATATTGDVTVNYGDDTNTANAYPKLYGDLYGGSALGDVNDAASDKTTVNVRNGSFGYYITTIPYNGETIEVQYGGNIYGGGLGRKAATGITPVEAKVYGEVHVNVGAAPADNPTGQADLARCSVYGCNNANGSPQADVYVDVYQAKRTSGVNTTTDEGYSIFNVYGGGNEADYISQGTHTQGTGYLTHVYIHGCDNTIDNVYGGGNAADAVGTVLFVEGGRFGDVFGGGNGLLTAANIGAGGSGMNINGGHVNYYYEGCNLNGVVSGGVYKPDLPTGYIDCGNLIVDTWFFGANEAVLFGDLENTIRCEDADKYHYKNVYAGSRCADIYGDVKLTVEGGVIENLFGGSKGYVTKPAHIKRFPTETEYVGHESEFPQSLQSFFAADTVNPSDYYGTGGNIILTIKGGTITNAFGGSDIKGNVDGTIQVIIDSTYSSCGFDLDMVYGGSNLAEYVPLSSTITSPIVELRKGHVNQNVFGGGKGDHEALDAGIANSNPKVTMTNGFWVKGNIYGGGEYATVEHDATVELTGGKVSTVYGGGKGYALGKDFGAVKGNTLVQMSAGQVERSIYGGGELASVGTFNDSTLVSYTTGTNAGTQVYVPTSCGTGTGLTKVVLSGGRVGDDQPYMPTSTLPGNDENGYVFCGGKGEADSIAYPQAVALAVVGSTYLEISGTALITASAYGGCENGLVLGDTYVKVAGGQIGLGHYLEGTDHRWDPPYHDSLWINATTYVHDKNAAQINRIASKFHECDAFPFDKDHYYIYDINADDYDSDGGSTSASNGHSFFGNVFGGGSGYYPIAAGVWRRTAGRVKGNCVTDIEGGHVLTCVYGGNEYTDVVGKVTVNMTGGTIGVPRTVAAMEANPVSCMLFGAGMGDPRTAFNTWTNVREVEVNITGGTIFGSVYGGGEDGHVTGDVNVTVGGNAFIGVWGTSSFDGNVFGSGRGFMGKALTAGVVGGNVNVNIENGHVLGNVYGGGRLASVGTHLVDVGTTNGYGMLQDGDDHGYITVNVSGGTIDHDVFGGSMGRVEKLDGTENTIWPRLAMAKQTKVNVTGGSIGEDVYGGSEFGSVRDSAVVVINLSHTTDTIFGNVFGGGMGSLDYTQNSNDSLDYPALLAGRVQGHTLVEVKNGTVKQNVYGGGNLASVGVVKNNNFLQGVTNVVVTGGNIGTSKLNPDCGHVYGGSKGVDADLAQHFNDYGNVNHTRVTIGAGRVWGSVYGGSANGHVLGNDSVFITTGAMIGTQATSSYDGNVFGGGKGNNTNYFAGRVGGNTYVDMVDGQVLGNIYGGGHYSFVGYGARPDNNNAVLMQDGTDHGHTKVKVRGGVVGNNNKTNTNPQDPDELVVEVYSASSMGSIYGGGKGDVAGLVAPHHAESALLVGMVKNTEVEISDTLGNNTHVYGIVFGGGEVANVGNYRWDLKPNGEAYNITITEGLAKVNISGGIIGGDRAKMRYEKDDTYPIYPKYNDDLGYVYGGGEGISDNPKYYKLIQQGPTATDTIRLVDLIATVNNTEVTISGGWVKGSVFGGAEAGHVRANTLVTIQGGQIGAGDNGTSDVRYTDPDVFIDPTVTPITNANALQGTVHWDFGKVVGTDTIYTPYDPVYVMQDNLPSDGKSWFGNVFGGGSGWFPYFDTVAGNPQSRWNPLSGKVWGNTHVVVEGGHVLNNVYGGNESTDIGGSATVDIKGGTVGVPRTKNQIVAQPCSGYVFGGGCGDPRTNFDTITLVNNTYVTVSGGIVYGSVYGGAEDGHVLGSTNVTVNQADGTTVIGCAGNSTSDGNIFGGGRNFFGENVKAGRVEGNINVSMSAGKIQGTIFGGGRQALSGIDKDGNFPTSNWDAAAHGNVIVTVTGGTIGTSICDTLLKCDESVGDIFGSGKGDTKNYENVMAGRVTNATVSVTGNTIVHGAVFGGGEMAGVGYRDTDNKFIDGTGETTVTIGTVGAAVADSPTIGSAQEFAYEKPGSGASNPNPGQWTMYDDQGKIFHTCTGNVFGASQGDVDNASPKWVSMASSKTANVTVNSGSIMGSVFGGSEQGTVIGNTHVTINGGTIGTYINTGSGATNPYYLGDVYGAGYGSDDDNENNVSANDSTATALSLAGRVYGTSVVDMLGGDVKCNVFGGSEFAYVGNTTLNVGSATKSDYTIGGNVYGANNRNGVVLGDVNVYVNAGTLGAGNVSNYTITRQSDVFGGGLGELTSTQGNVTVTVDTLNKTVGTTIFGDVYGGSAYGSVNDANTDRTTVNILAGTLATHRTQQTSTAGISYYDYQGGNVFGGGLGETNNADKGKVNGKVTVNIGSGKYYTTSPFYEDLQGDATINGNIYGCNNVGGAPQDSVLVNIFKTAHTASDSATYVGTEPATLTYALNNVFGGGNEADNSVSSSTVRVNIVSCDNTIERVFGGGNAAASNNVYTDIQGGRIDKVFGGGNGERGSSYAADIMGNDTLALHGGTINAFIVGSNEHGIIHGQSYVLMDGIGPCGTDVDEFFCGGNYVDVYGDVNAVISCTDGALMTVRNLYGGCNQACIKKKTDGSGTGGNVNLTVQGGTFQNVYGGSKGRPSTDPNGVFDAYIEGNVTLTITGGTIDTVFGGSNILGNVQGTITVNIDSDNSSSCPLVIHNVYGGGRGASHTPNNLPSGEKPVSPMVNILNGTISKNDAGKLGNVFGGGYGASAVVTSNPKVTIGSATSTDEATVEGNVYGGGDAADITGNTTVNFDTRSKVTVNGDVFGGGHNAAVNGSATVNINE